MIDKNAVERKYSQFPTREEVKKNPKLAYSDHAMILTKVPMAKKDINIVSLNTLDSVFCSGVHPKNRDDIYAGFNLMWVDEQTTLKTLPPPKINTFLIQGETLFFWEVNTKEPLQLHLDKKTGRTWVSFAENLKNLTVENTRSGTFQDLLVISDFFTTENKDYYSVIEDNYYIERYSRIAQGLKNAVNNNDVDVILLQEVNKHAGSLLKEPLGTDWEIITDRNKNGLSLISCYKTTRLKITKQSLNDVQRIRTMTFQDTQNDNITVDIHNIWGLFNDFPHSMESVCKNALMDTESTISIIVGDTNSRIAPLDDDKRNLTTGLVPAIFNYQYNVSDDYQVTDHPDGGFYRSEDNTIHQLPIERLDFESGRVIENNQDLIESTVSIDFRMVMCLDETYKTKPVINGKTIFEYEKSLQEDLGIPNLLFRMASDSFNNKAVAIRFPNKSPVFGFIKDKLKNVVGFQCKLNVASTATSDQSNLFNCVFISLDKAPLLHEAITEYKTECEKATNKQLPTINPHPTMGSIIAKRAGYSLIALGIVALVVLGIALGVMLFPLAPMSISILGALAVAAKVAALPVLATTVAGPFIATGIILGATGGILAVGNLVANTVTWIKYKRLKPSSQSNNTDKTHSTYKTPLSNKQFIDSGIQSTHPRKENNTDNVTEQKGKPPINNKHEHEHEPKRQNGLNPN